MSLGSVPKKKKGSITYSIVYFSLLFIFFNFDKNVRKCVFKWDQKDNEIKKFGVFSRDLWLFLVVEIFEFLILFSVFFLPKSYKNPQKSSPHRGIQGKFYRENKGVEGSTKVIYMMYNKHPPDCTKICRFRSMSCI